MSTPESMSTPQPESTPRLQLGLRHGDGDDTWAASNFILMMFVPSPELRLPRKKRTATPMTAMHEEAWEHVVQEPAATLWPLSSQPLLATLSGTKA